MGDVEAAASRAGDASGLRLLLLLHGELRGCWDADSESGTGSGDGWMHVKCDVAVVLCVVFVLLRLL